MRILALLALFAVSCAHARYERIVDDAVAGPLREGKYAGAVLVMHDGKPLVRKAYGFDNTATPYVRTSTGIGIGYGWFIHDGGIFGHNGAGGGFRAFNYTVPAKKLIVVVLSNVAEVDTTWVRAMVDKLATSVR